MSWINDHVMINEVCKIIDDHVMSILRTWVDLWWHSSRRDWSRESWKKYLSSDEWEDMHLSSVRVFDRGNDEAGSTQGHLTL